MNAAELAALIAAVFWALLVCVGVFVLLRLGRFLGESSKLVADVRERGDILLTRAQAAVDGAQAAVDRAGRQLDQAESVTASMDELGTGMAELAGQVSALASFGRALTGGPVGRAAALAYGVRHAVSLRRGANRTLPGSLIDRDVAPARCGRRQLSGVLEAGRDAHPMRDAGVVEHPADRRQQPSRPAAARRRVHHQTAAAGHGTSGRPGR